MNVAATDECSSCSVVTTDKTESDSTFILSAPLQKTINNDIATINGKVNKMDMKKIRHKFRWFKNGDKEDIDKCRKQLKLRLAKVIRKHAQSLYVNENVLPYYVVLDFEATCEAVNPPGYRHEIIEFPAVLVNSSTLQIEDSFKMICRPTIKPKLSPFCTQLTGISQEQVDAAEPFPAALSAFQAWLDSHHLGDFTVVTDGPWDMTRFLHGQCLLAGIEYPQWAHRWLDIRKVFGKFYQQRRTSLAAMLDHLGMAFEGRPHCGLDDARNIARVLVHVLCDGAALLPNETLTFKAKAGRDRVLAEADPERDLVEQLSQMTLEAERAAIPLATKQLSYRDVKVQRSRMIHALTMRPDGDSGFEEEPEVETCGEDQEEITIVRRKKFNPKKGKGKTKKNRY